MSRGEGYAVGVIEVVTRDVEVTIAAADLDAVEGEQAVVLARNEGRELRGADFDAAAVWRDDERARRRSLVHVDPVVLVERLTGLQVRERCVLVLAHEPTTTSTYGRDKTGSHRARP